MITAKLSSYVPCVVAHIIGSNRGSVHTVVFYFVLCAHCSRFDGHKYRSGLSLSVIRSSCGLSHYFLPFPA